MCHIIAGGQHCGQHFMVAQHGAMRAQRQRGGKWDILKQLPAGGWTTLRELELGKLSSRELGFEPITRVIKSLHRT